MSRVLLDTSAYSALMAGAQGSPMRWLAARRSCLLLEGFFSGSRNAENRSILARFRDKPRGVTIPITDETAEWFAQIKRGLRAKGRPIPINDVWIAASCMEHGAVLLSLDGLRRVVL